MIGGAQAALFEPTPAECAPLALSHAKKAEAARKLAEVASSRGWVSVHREFSELASRHEVEAEDLAMLADFYRLGGVVS